jgi:hypothetical protein
MTAAGSADAAAERPPLVAVLCRVGILYEALSPVLGSVAEVRRFPTEGGDTAGLLRWLRPDAIVVDTQEEADEAMTFARESKTPLVQVRLRERKLLVLTNGSWEEPENGLASAEAIRNIVVGGIYGRRGG